MPEKRPVRRKELKRHLPLVRFRGAHFDLAEAIYRIGVKSNERLNRLVRLANSRKERLNPGQQQIVSEIIRPSYSSLQYYLKGLNDGSLTGTFKQFNHVDITEKEFIRAVEAGFMANIKQKEFWHLFRNLEYVYQDWLSNPKTRIPASTARKALYIARTITSTAAASYASHYTPKPFTPTLFRAQERDTPFWINGAMENFGYVGI